MRAALLTRQVLTYHHARLNATTRVFDQLDVISLANEAKFTALLSSRVDRCYGLYRLYPDLVSYQKAAASGDVLARVGTVLDELRPHVVAIAGWASAESHAALLWAHENRCGVVLMSDSQVHDAQRNPLRDWIKGRIVRLTGAGLAAGRSHRAYLERLGLEADRVKLGYDVVDNYHFTRGAERAREEHETARAQLFLPLRYILASARFVPKKNLEGLLRAYARARERVVSPADLLIAGDGEGRAAIEVLVRKLGLDGHVHLPGFFAYDDLPALYALAEGFVHVPLSEQWGLVVNEAAAAGLPLVLSEECGAAQELLKPGCNGWRTPAKDTSALADALTAMLTLTATERQTLGAESARIVADWGPERFAQGLVGAARIARGRPVNRISPLDRWILQYMSRKVVEAVA